MNEPKKGIIIVGQQGSGKTMKATEIASQFNEENVTWINYPLTDYKSNRVTESLNKARWKDKTELVVIDALVSIADVQSMRRFTSDGFKIGKQGRNPYLIHPKIVLVCGSDITKEAILSSHIICSQFDIIECSYKSELELWAERYFTKEHRRLDEFVLSQSAYENYCSECHHKLNTFEFMDALKRWCARNEYILNPSDYFDLDCNELATQNINQFILIKTPFQMNDFSKIHDICGEQVLVQKLDNEHGQPTIQIRYGFIGGTLAEMYLFSDVESQNHFFTNIATLEYVKMRRKQLLAKLVVAGIPLSNN